MRTASNIFIYPFTIIAIAFLAAGFIIGEASSIYMGGVLAYNSMIIGYSMEWIHNYFADRKHLKAHALYFGFTPIPFERNDVFRDRVLKEIHKESYNTTTFHMTDN